MKWRPIKTAPKDREIWIKPKYGLPPMRGHWHERTPGNKGFAFIAGRNVDPTHWMPLPGPPDESEYNLAT